ncbi:MAG: DUF4062 domain-containing protein, partial [Planctomycetota bacterium]
MSLNIFISGVSSDFRERRIALANRLRKFRNLDLYPIVQEDLIESASPSGNLIHKLIANVRQCPLVLCFVGGNSGYPHELEQRVQCQRLVEATLRDSFHLDTERLGTLWSRWSKNDLGMTYTQLEFFLAASVFASETRLRVFLPPKTHEDHDEQQRQYLKFLYQQHQTIDWSPLENAEEDAVTVAVEFGLQSRDVQRRFSIPDRAISAAAAVTRGLVVLEDVVLRGQQTHEHYDRFYEHVVWPRLTEAVVLLTQKSTPFPVRPDFEHLLTVQHERGSTLAFQTRKGTHVIRHGEDLKTDFESHVFRGVTSETTIRAIRPDGRMLLTYSVADGYQLHDTDKPVFGSYHLANRDSFWLESDALAGDDRCPVFMLPQGNKYLCVQYEDAVFNESVVEEHSIPHTYHLQLSHRPLGLPRDGSSEVIELPMNDIWAWLKDDVAVLFDRAADAVVLSRYRVANLADLFALPVTAVYDGDVIDQ